jgi:PilZ domain
MESGGAVERENPAGGERILPRHQFEARVKIEILRGNEKLFTEGWARDLSGSGLGAFVGATLQLAERVILRIPLGIDLELEVPAIVTRNVGTEYGFRFTALSRLQREQIREAVAGSKVVAFVPAPE